MKNFIAYDKTTGEVLGGGCSLDPEAGATDAVGVLVLDEFVKPSRVEVDLSGPEPVVVHLDQTILDTRNFDQTKKRAKYEVLVASEAARKHFITSLPGQDAIYQAKYEEALAFQADPNPDMAQYPFISAEVGLTAATAAELAAMWIQLRTAWITAAASVENARFVANATINAATTVSEVYAAEAQLKASLDAVMAGV